MFDNWVKRKRPARLERRFVFENYELTRAFLDIMADLSEKEGFYPDINFGTMHVNMTIHLDADGGGLERSQRQFAEQLDQLVPENRVNAPVDRQVAVEGSKR